MKNSTVTFTVGDVRQQCHSQTCVGSHIHYMTSRSERPIELWWHFLNCFYDRFDCWLCVQSLLMVMIGSERPDSPIGLGNRASHLLQCCSLIKSIDQSHTFLALELQMVDRQETRLHDLLTPLHLNNTHWTRSEQKMPLCQCDIMLLKAAGCWKKKTASRCVQGRYRQLKVIHNKHKHTHTHSHARQPITA